MEENSLLKFLDGEISLEKVCLKGLADEKSSVRGDGDDLVLGLKDAGG